MLRHAHSTSLTVNLARDWGGGGGGGGGELANSPAFYLLLAFTQRPAPKFNEGKP